MAFQGMLGHLAHPATTPVWGRDKCSAAPAICARSVPARSHVRTPSVSGMARAGPEGGTDTVAVTLNPQKPERAASKSVYMNEVEMIIGFFLRLRRKIIVVRHPV